MKQFPVAAQTLEAFRKGFAADKSLRAAANAASKTDLAEIAFCGMEAARLHHHFSVEIPTMSATNQKSSGRCWMFAALNVLRERVAAKLNLEQFELSQSYCAFWDKFERVNYFYDCILDTAELPTDDRTVTYLLQTGVHDGGQWDMFVNIVKKYGVVPKHAMPETCQSSSTGSMNRLLNTNLKAGAAALRKLCRENPGEAAVLAKKQELLKQAFDFLCICYGMPPETFDFEYADKDKEYHIDRNLTPKSFFEKYVDMDLDSYLSIIDAPTQDKPYHKMYTVKYLGNVAEGQKVAYLNLPMEEMKALIIRQLQAGEVVWFGSDVGKFGDRAGGTWDDKSFEYELLTGLDLALTKEERLDYRDSCMCHAMVITGVNLTDGKPNRWKIENSWGDDRGEKGYYIASDSWFDEFVYQAVIRREYLETYDLNQELIELAPWDPMGSLAR